ncbi:hypothetical protein I3U51_14365 [Mycobacteroides abscessus subsp. abscessus]|uniref:hypothetical protein n=1 Tax=Mycobacteroides abscessus TaxID=36809 RepID=UPI0009C94895|nr:hypothetical protein [Mycobacteroides abscessus]MBN7441706.1 hypothetical protein [Mycobacteroides abscessus subsp. abscessus]SLH44711.1 Uncharacterised protein [Mycobacteroides abscessus subsp. abscessus]
MAKGDWSASYVVPSLALSLTAAGFLVAHTINPEAKVDGWTVALLVILFLPWLRTVFESIDFPGGGSVKFRREVKAEQERQAKEIEAMWFLLGRFLQKPERELLQRLAKGEEVRVTDGPGDRLFHQVDSLRRTGMIALKPGLREQYQQLSTTTGQTSMDLTIVGDLYEISDAGRKYLDLIATLPDVEQSYPDASELRTGPSTPPL